MCLINFQYKNHPVYKLVVAANRDEFYGRPAREAHFWEDHPEILAGRDLSQMGTWLGVTKSGRFAALTNFRDPSLPEPGKTSRGALVREFLASEMTPENYLKALDPAAFTGFNVLLGDTQDLFYYNNLQQEIVEISPGIHGLSNHFLNTPWPKVVKGKAGLQNYLDANLEAEPDDLFEILRDAEPAPDSHLPETGVGWELERILSPLFIKTPDYGTRSATVLMVDYDNNVTFAERVYEKGEMADQQVFHFSVQ